MLENLALIIKIAFSGYALLAYALFGLFLLLLKRIGAEPKTFERVRPPVTIRTKEAEDGLDSD